MKPGKYWSEMFISSSKTENNTDSLIISTEEPVKYTEERPIIYSHISTDNYEEVSAFYSEQNKMKSGNITLLPVPELTKYLSLNNYSVIIRNQTGKLLGSIISLNLPIRANGEILYHGCTTFLTIHKSIQGHGLCMALIRKLIEKGYQDKIYCSYYTIPFQLGANSLKIDCYYRPIVLSKCVELGFVYPDYNNIRMKTKNRLLYSVKKPLHFNYRKATSEDLAYYRQVTKDKKFVFYPDEVLWEQFIKLFPTYIISYQEEKVGIVAFNTVYCSMQTNNSNNKSTIGKIAMPIICNGDMNLILSVLPSIVCDHDVLYIYCCGDMSSEVLFKKNYLKTDNSVWFSLYNNRMNLDVRDLSVPIL